MATTIPNTTNPQTTSPSTQPTDSCQISIPDYSTLRTQNIAKINDYYNTLLSSYTKNYTDYSTQSVSANVNDRTYADKTLKPKVIDYNKQVINLSQTLINNVNQDTDLITDQKNQLADKMADIDTLMDNIKMLKDKDSEMTVLASGRLDSLMTTKTGTEDMQFTTYIYISISVLLVLLIIGLIVYLVYTNYRINNNTNTSNSVKINNSMKTNNSL